jgi:hypothetical protein
VKKVFPLGSRRHAQFTRLAYGSIFPPPQRPRLTNKRAIMSLDHVLALLLGLSLLTLAPPALARDSSDSPGYSADTLTFERWCVEIQQYEVDRCARQDAGDVASYRRSLDRLQSIEVEHDKEVRKQREFKRTFEAHTNLDRNRRFDF